MKKSVLTMIKNESGEYQAVFTNKHSRKLYLALSLSGDICTVNECYYLDRSTKKIPKALNFGAFGSEDILNKISRELDKTFSEIRFLENSILTKEKLIDSYLSEEKKKILLLLKTDSQLRTIFKNKYHRSIYLEITLLEERALISDCHYADTRSEEIPHGLKTIYFSFSMEGLLKIVNTELEGGFTDVAITEEHTLVLNSPICGRI